MKKFIALFGVILPICLAVFASPLYATKLISVSADIVEISGSVTKEIGANWNELFQFAEESVPGIFTVGDFKRLTQLQSTIRALENEGKAQLLSNPKIITKDKSPAGFLVGGDVPFPTVGATGSVGVDFKKFGVGLQVAPEIVGKTRISAEIELTVSGPDYSRPMTIQNISIPTFKSRELKTHIEMNSGDTLVVGGLKRSEKNTSYRRIPILGSIPLIGLLFRHKATTNEEATLFLFVTLEIVKS
ncbi:hypothetical protein ACFL6Y_11240 [Elusimicrobiota bacterium]